MPYAVAVDIGGTFTDLVAYDHDGRVTNVQEPFGVSLSYAYDGNGNQTQVVDSFGGTQTSTYDLEYRLTSRTYTGQSQNLREDFTYNAQGLVATDKRYSDLSGTTLVAETDYGYDGSGNRTNTTLLGCVWVSSSSCSTTTGACTSKASRSSATTFQRTR